MHENETFSRQLSEIRRKKVLWENGKPVWLLWGGDRRRRLFKQNTKTRLIKNLVAFTWGALSDERAS